MLEVISKQGEVDKPAGEEARRHHVNPEHSRQRLVRFRFRRMTFVRTEISGKKQRHECQNGRATERQKCRPEHVRSGDNPGNDQRTDDRAGLIHRSMNAEAFTMTDDLRRFGKQDVTSRPANRFAGALDRNEHCRRLP